MDIFKLPNLPYEYNALEPYIDEATMKVHHDKHHAAYVEKLNAAIEGRDEYAKKSIDDILKNTAAIDENIRQSVINNGGGHANHSFFWQIMTPKSDKSPSGKLMDALNKTFSSFTKFKESFSQVALTRFGSGWAWLSLDKDKLVIESTPNQDTPLSSGKTPLFCLDVWEHAYYLKYQNRRADYIEAFWNVVNWKKIEELFEKS